MKNQIKMLKVKIKSLAEEARIIRREERRALGRRVSKGKFVGRDDKLHFSLRVHRRDDVRKEQRLSLLAYAFLRGRPLAKVDPQAHKLEPADWKRVRALVGKFGRLPYYRPDESEELSLDTSLTGWRAAAVAK